MMIISFKKKYGISPKWRRDRLAKAERDYKFSSG